MAKGRALSNSLTLQYDKVLYLLDESKAARKLKRKNIAIYDFADATIKIKHQGVELPYQIFDKLRRIKSGDIEEQMYIYLLCLIH